MFGYTSTASGLEYFAFDTLLVVFCAASSTGEVGEWLGGMFSGVHNAAGH